MRGERRRVRRGEHAVALAVDQLAFFLGVAAPQKKHHAFALAVDVLDGLVGEFFPALALVGSGLAGAHGEHRVEQQHALACPRLEIPLVGGFLENSIAVLPFADLSEQGDQAYLADGVSEEILNLLADLRTDRGLTYLMVSHDLPVIGHMCDRLAVMKDGEIVETMDVAQLRQMKAVHPYSQELLAASVV